MRRRAEEVVARMAKARRVEKVSGRRRGKARRMCL